MQRCPRLEHPGQGSIGNLTTQLFGLEKQMKKGSTAKVALTVDCHSERSEESPSLWWWRPFALLRVTGWVLRYCNSRLPRIPRYTVTLVVTNACGTDSDSVTVTVSSAVGANSIFIPSTPPVSEIIAFTTGVIPSNAIASYAWNVGGRRRQYRRQRLREGSLSGRHHPR